MRRISPNDARWAALLALLDAPPKCAVKRAEPALAKQGFGVRRRGLEVSNGWVGRL